METGKKYGLYRRAGTGTGRQVSQEERRRALRREGTPRREQGGQGTEAAPSGTSPGGGHVDARRVTGAIAEAVPGTQTNELAEDEAVPGETPLVGWHYLSDAACLTRPRLFYACFVVSLFARLP